MIDARSRLQIGSETLACEFEDFRRNVNGTGRFSGTWRSRFDTQRATHLIYRLVFGDTPKAEQSNDRQQEHRSMTSSNASRVHQYLQAVAAMGAPERHGDFPVREMAAHSAAPSAQGSGSRA